MNKHQVLDMIHQRYQYDTVLLVVTANNNVPSVRSVDSFFHEGSFWIVTDTRCNYVKEIMANENAMISDGGHNRFWSKAVVTGHPLSEQNKEIRNVFLEKFSHWYKEVNNEDLDTVCYVKVTPYKGYFHKDKIGYNFNFSNDEIIIGDITHHIDVKLEPFFE